MDTPQARNSVGIHLSRLCLLFERGWPLERANEAMLAITAGKFSYPWLAPYTQPSAMTVAEVLQARTAASHRVTVVQWAEFVWQQWSPHHAIIRAWLDGV